jgi:hypothetical protein
MTNDGVDIRFMPRLMRWDIAGRLTPKRWAVSAIVNQAGAPFCEAVAISPVNCCGGTGAQTCCGHPFSHRLVKSMLEV